MELESLANRRADNEDALVQVKAWIRPLPEEVEPSPEFLRRTRLQLLELPGQTPPRSEQQAA